MLCEVGLVDVEKGILDDLVIGNSDILIKVNVVKFKFIVVVLENLNGNKVLEEFLVD